ncbi:hypothetical protein GIS00_14070 [Nakamurella sp. YIM 132087]|uniref:DNA-binding protein n=1 Tax=Nakamurella alba TaxID=2665158 RepID=A0A7K1FLP4_9ACTN|nr:hypothetical protein [Nakamurella alba]MTD15065.1 hypothetical protein [Nakamurella alba]
MTTLAEVLSQYGPDLDEGEFLADLKAKLAAVHRDDGPGLTIGELDFLESHGGPDARAVVHDWDPVAQRRRRQEVAAGSVQSVWAATMSASEVAETLGKGRPQISRDLKARKLYGIRVGSQWRIPRWQFVNGAVLPGLDGVVPAIPDDLHPTAIEGFMTTEQDELSGRSPISYLVSGGDPRVVAELLDGLDR